MVARTVIVLLAGFVMSFQHLLYFLVGEASVAAYDGMCQVPVLHLCLFVESEDDAVSQFMAVFGLLALVLFWDRSFLYCLLF